MSYLAIAVTAASVILMLRGCVSRRLERLRSRHADEMRSEADEETRSLFQGGA